jgi:WD40 repeat protein
VSAAIAAAPALPRFALPPEPYPGLRPFGRQEHRIFFGREEMIDTIIDSLARNNLIVVHGASGSGKSSIVRAGVLPWLELQQSRRGGWRTKTLRPAGGPLRNLAAALAEALGPAPGASGVDAAASWHTRLALGSAVLDDIEARLDGMRGGLCLLIDQFEELFRYARETSLEEAKLLTELLCVLTSKRRPAPHLFVVLTMRSDYLGECARFEGFAETVNTCQYLLPRLDDFALLRAVHEPAKLYGGTIDPAVGDRLLFAMRQEEDGLPVLQHALMRACVCARARHEFDRGWTVTLADLAWAEGEHGALSKHADEVMAELRARDPAYETAAEWLFRSLTELDAEGRVIRRPCRLAELVAVAGNDRAGVSAVVAAFQAPGRNFLTANPPDRLDDDSEIDVSHEALIRRWRQLSDPTRDAEKNEPAGWMWREFEDGQRWRALAVQARVFRNDRSKSATLSPATTEAYASWWPEHTPAWAARYVRDRELAGEEYQEVSALWDASQKALELEHTRLERELDEEKGRSVQLLRVQRFMTLTAALVALIMAVAGVSSWILRQQATREGQRADAELEKALRTHSLFLAEVARQERAEGDAGTAILLALAALPDPGTGDHRPYVTDAERQLDGAARSIRELALLPGHDKSVRGVAFSRDGRRIVTASDDRTARLWDATTGKPIGEPIKGHEDAVWSAAFSPDGTRIVTASADGTARLWDSATGRPIGEPLKGHDGAVWSAAFSPDGARIVTASIDQTARLWDSATGGPIGAPLKGHGFAVLSAAFSPDGTRIVTASVDRTARLWDAATGEPIGEPLNGHAGGVTSAAFSPDGRRIVTASYDRTARLWDSATGRPIGDPLEGHKDRVWSAAFSPDGTHVVTASADGMARLWDIRTGKPTSELLSGHEGEVLGAAFSQDGTRIVTAGSDGTARLWDGEGSKAAGQPLEGPRVWIKGVAFSPDGARILTASPDGTWQWNADTGKPVGERLPITWGWFERATFSPDGRRVVIFFHGTAQIRDVATGRRIVDRLVEHDGTALSAAFSPDGSRIVTASSDKTARLWDAETGKSIGGPLVGHQGEVRSAAFSADGRLIVTASEDNTARLWDAATGRPLGEPLAGHKGWVQTAAFSRDGRRVVTASDDGTARLWDTATGRLMRELKGHAAAVRSAAFSPDGKRIVTASYDRTARVWDGVTGKPVAELGHDSPPQSVLFSPDGKRIVTVSDNGAGRLWTVFPDTQQLVAHARAIVPRCLTPAQRATYFLPPEARAWCIEMAKWPYHTGEWKAWLRDTRAGKSPPLPATE